MGMGVRGEEPRHRFSSQAGFLLLVVPLALGALALLAFQAIHRTRTAMRLAGGDLEYVKTTFCARRCAALAANAVGKTLNANGRVVAGGTDCSCSEPSFSGAADAAGPSCRNLVGAPATGSAPNCYGVETAVTEVGIEVACRDGRSRSATLREEVAYAELPVFQFAVFFERVLEIHPGQDMEIRGRVHSNDTIRLYPGNAAVDFHDWITSARTVEAGRAGWAAHAWVGFPRLDPAGPDARFDIPNVPFRPLHEVVPSWAAWSQAHRVAYGNRAGVCGAVERLELPLGGVPRPRDLIEWRDPGDGAALQARKFAWRASLIWKDGAWHDRDMRPASLSDPARLPPAKVIAVGGRVTFWDGRDTLMVRLVPIDVRRLQQREGDSLVYLHDRLVDAGQRGRDVGGFLLYNARRLERPLTIASNSRLYGWGDFNVDSSYTGPDGARSAWPAALVCDAYTQLSNEWDGREYPAGARYAPVLAKNPRARAVLNACLMAGMPERRGSWSGQGGYHNLVHFLEDWSGTVFEFSGSAAAMWSSEVSTGFTSIEFYLPPVRRWAFDPMYRKLANMPPATPRLVGPKLASWELARL